MANEHSIRVSARGEFGQLERGLKNLKKDLNSVLGEIDKGARRGGIFDETQLRALDIYRGRFKGTMDELNREFEKQNAIIDELERKKEKASRTDRENVQKEITGREKKLDVIRKELRALEDLNRRRNQESRGYSTSTSPLGGSPGGGGASGMGAGAGLLGAGMSKMMGAGKFVAGLAGLVGIASMAQEAYQLAYQSQVTPMNLSQRLRGSGYAGSAKGMWDEIGGIGRNDSMGYTSGETWQFMDTYSRNAGAMNPHQLENALKFGRGYGLEAQETAGALSSVRELGGTTTATEFADMIASSVEKSGMTPRILEVMQTSAGLLANMNTTLKDSGAKQILAYQTTLDTIGLNNGMMKLTGEQGANIISGLGGIYSPSQDNNWKYMGMQALQRHNPSKYGNMDLYGLESAFEDGLMNVDNLPAMSGFLKEKSGGNQQLEKRMMQRWLQDGGYNATKTQVDDLYGATNGLTVFDEEKMKSVMKDLESGDGTAKYQERMGQTGQDILNVNSRFEKQMENLGQPLLEIVTGLKEGVTSILEEVTGNGSEGVIVEIRDFLENNWGLLASALGIAGLATLLKKIVPGGDGSGGKGSKGGGIVPLAGAGALGWGALIAGVATGGKQAMDVFSSGNKEEHAEYARKAGLNPDDVTGLDRWFAEMGAILPGVDPQDFYNLFSKETTDKHKKNMEGFFGTLFPSWNVPSPSSKESDQAMKEFLAKPQPFSVINPTTWGTGLKEIKIPESWGKNFEEMKLGFFSLANEAFGWDLGGEKRQSAVDSLVSLGSQGVVDIAGMTEHGKAKLQELADQGLIKLTEGAQMQTTLLSGFTVDGMAKLQQLADQGLISIGGFTEDGTAKITALSEEGLTELTKLKDNGSADLSTFKTEGTLRITELSEEGANQLINLQKNGSLSMESMDTTTKEKLELVRTNTKTSLSDIKGEHKKWSDRLIGKDGIFTKWADGATKIFEGLTAWFKDFMPSWLGGGDSDVGFLNGGGKSVTKETKSFEDALAREGAKYGITDTNLLMAIMNQESKGRSTDVMQSSESLGLARNSLGTDDSIKQGVKYFAEALEKAGGDVEMALQAYNYGHGYIDYAKKNGGHSRATASAFSDARGGNYGDRNYVDNVMQYYPQASAGGDFFNGWENRITSRYGNNESFRKHTHRGLDINGEQGDPLQALMGGRVSFIKYDDGSSLDDDGKKNTRGGGTELGIEMANGETYFYSHMSKVLEGLKVGDMIQAGQYVGNVGGDVGKAGSGSSTTGSHLHLGYMDKQGHLQDPLKLMQALGGAGDSDIGTTSAQKNITVTLKLDGAGASQLNTMTESSLRTLITDGIKEYERMRTLLNPSTGGY